MHEIFIEKAILSRFFVQARKIKRWGGHIFFYKHVALTGLKIVKLFNFHSQLFFLLFSNITFSTYSEGTNPVFI